MNFIKNISIKNILFCLPFLAIGLLHLQSAKPYRNVAELANLKPADNVKFTLKTWWDGEFQPKKELYWNDNFGFRPDFVRWHNEIDYRAFNKLGGGLVKGKNGCFYGSDYIDAFYGKNCIGRESMNKVVEKLELLQKNLQKDGKKLIISLAADKCSYMSEGIPDNKKQARGITNSDIFLEILEQKNIACLNLRDYMITMKKTTAYPLFPMHGTHWSQYAGFFALDTLNKTIAKTLNIKMPKAQIIANKISKEPLEKDGDLAWFANLKLPLKGYPLAYPTVVASDTINTKKPAILTIADSFYWTLYDFHNSKQFYKKQTFIFYHSDVCIDGEYSRETFDAQKVAAYLKDVDVVVLSATSINIQNIGWETVDEINKFYANIYK